MDIAQDKPKMTPKDFFMYLGVAVSLYASAGALVSLLFSIIDQLVPDALNPSYSAVWAGDGMRFAIATLIVAFPLYISLSWLIRKEIAVNVAKYQLSIRKWLVYFTLFVAGATIAGDVIALVNSYLGGEVTARFVWKMLSVLVVAGVVFAYYFYDLKRAASGDTEVNRPLILAAIAGVVIAIIAGFVVVGSPSEIRALRFDETRVNNLADIQWQIIAYYQNHGALPPALEDLTDDITGYMAPRDPETKEAYEYRVIAPLSFELCASFAREQKSESVDEFSRAYPAPFFGQNFNHGVGRTCFERTIDPLEHPVLKR